MLIEEVKVGCTLAMLQCLDRPHRLAYVLGEILEFSRPEAAEVLAISPALFRKRLQQAREEVLAFTKSCIDNAIHSAAGPRRREDCATRVLVADRRPVEGVGRQVEKRLRASCDADRRGLWVP